MCFNSKQTGMVIIADDLTGALDTAIKFSQRGAHTVAIDARGAEQLVPYLEEGYEVVSVNTATRHMEGEKAYRIVHSLVRCALEHGVGCIYKKTDSVLRGNIAFEIEALKDASRAAFIPFAPAYPELRRTVEDGIMKVAGIPLAQTSFAQDPFEPITSSDTRDLFLNSPLKAVSTCDGSFIPADGQADVVVYDGRTGEDMYKLAQNLYKAGCRVFCGCAGFAEALSRLLFCGHVMPGRLVPRPMLVVCGSVNPVSKRQLEVLEKGGVTRVRLTEGEALEPDFTSSVRCGDLVDVIMGDLETEGLVILDTLADISAVRGSAMESACKVSRALASIVHSCIDRGEFTVFVIGGDTMLSLLEELGRVAVEPVSELEEGIVLSYVHHDGRRMTLLSKSGGFGSDDLIWSLVNDKENEYQEVKL